MKTNVAPESLLEFACSVSRTGAWHYDIARDCVTWSNVTRTLFGESADTPITLEKAMRYYAPESRDRLVAAIERCVADGTPYDLQLELDLPDGRLFARAIGKPQRDADGTIVGLAGSFQDITAIVEAQNRSAKAEAELEFVMRTMPDGFFMLDEGWRFSFVNPASRAMLQRDPETLIGQVVWDVFPEAVGSRFEAEYRAVRDTQRSSTFVAFFPPLATWFEVNAHPSRNGVAVHFRDVTARIEEQEQLLLFRTAVEHQPVGVLILEASADTPLSCKRIVFANAAMADGARSTRDAVLGGTLGDIIRLDDGGAELDALGHILMSGGATRRSIEAATPSGRKRMFEVIGAPIHAPDGAVRHVVLILDDITDRLQAETERRRNERLTLLGQLAGGVSHDFNNLLAVIMGNIELMALTDDPQETAILRDEALTAVKRGKTLNESLLAFAGRSAIDARATDMGDFLRTIHGLMRRTLPSNILIETQIAPNTPPVQLDHTMAESCVLNLVINARAALPGGGRIVIAIEPRTARAGRDAPPQRWVMLSVSDNGVGIPEALHDAVFDPFFTTRGVGEGSGLGLSRVRGYVEQAGGFVELESRVGRGTTVRLYFPVATVDDRPVDSAAAQSSPSEPQHGAGSILLVDDNRAVARATARLLGSLGYSVKTAHDGTEAQTAFADDGPFDYLVSDIVMPGEPGNVLAARLRAAKPDLRIVLISGYPENADTFAESDPLTVFLEKPASRAALGAALRSLA